MPHEHSGKIGKIAMDEETFHPTCEECGKYIFAVDSCKGHALPVSKEALLAAEGAG